MLLLTGLQGLRLRDIHVVVLGLHQGGVRGDGYYHAGRSSELCNESSSAHRCAGDLYAHTGLLQKTHPLCSNRLRCSHHLLSAVLRFSTKLCDDLALSLARPRNRSSHLYPICTLDRAMATLAPNAASARVHRGSKATARASDSAGHGRRTHGCSHRSLIHRTAPYACRHWDPYSR